jgi:hypothetical protein
LDLLLKTLIAGGLGLALGLWSAESALRVSRGAEGTTRIGAWSTAAKAGTPEADPYTRATIERSGEIPLAPGEGLQLVARVDDAGRALNPRCVYLVGRKVPAARYWTLGVINPNGLPIANPAQRLVFRSSEIVRDGDGGFTIAVSPSARAGNWLPIGREEPFYLALRLYDTPFSATAAAIDKDALPHIVREVCR